MSGSLEHPTLSASLLPLSEPTHGEALQHTANYTLRTKARCPCWATVTNAIQTGTDYRLKNSHLSLPALTSIQPRTGRTRGAWAVGSPREMLCYTSSPYQLLLLLHFFPEQAGTSNCKSVHIPANLLSHYNPRSARNMSNAVVESKTGHSMDSKPASNFKGKAKSSTTGNFEGTKNCVLQHVE